MSLLLRLRYDLVPSSLYAVLPVHCFPLPARRGIRLCVSGGWEEEVVLFTRESITNEDPPNAQEEEVNDDEEKVKVVEVVVEEGVVFTRENRGVSARRQMCAYVLARGSGGEARRCKTQGLRQQSTGECESGSKSTSRTVIDKGGLSRCCCCCSNFD